MRLTADGEYIPDLVFAVMDWNGDGLDDLVCKPYGRNEIHVYLNTGGRDRCGLPLLTTGPVVDLSPLLGPGGQTGAGKMQHFPPRSSLLH